MIHFGDALRLWIRGKGYDFISDFVEDVSGFNRGTPEHVSFRNKLNTVLKKSRFSKLNWKNLETLIPDLTREELEEIAQAPPTHPPTYEQHSKPIQKIEERPVVYDEKRLRLDAQERREIKSMLKEILERVDRISKIKNND